MPPSARAVVLGLAGALALGVGAYAYRVVSHAAPDLPPPAVSTPERFRFDAHATPRPLPEVRFVDGAGATRTLADFAGKVVLLNLWATWCPPCREEMPTLERLQARLGGAQFEVLALAMDRPVAVESFYARLGLEALETYVDVTGEASERLAARGLPTTLLIDRAGREIGRTVGPADWDSEEVLALIRRHLDGADPAAKPRA